jgi:hypothetical protein
MDISCLFFLPHFNLYSMLALVYLFNELLFLAAGFSWGKTRYVGDNNTGTI